MHDLILSFGLTRIATRYSVLLGAVQSQGVLLLRLLGTLGVIHRGM